MRLFPILPLETVAIRPIVRRQQEQREFKRESEREPETPEAVEEVSAHSDEPQRRPMKGYGGLSADGGIDIRI